ncbi:MAG: zinc ABC transporter substrate-binding protein [Pirellulaceae bacterium]|nr:zinc ABC transporter substrate-binding protein [Pirellulaceae bacterium]
MRSFLLFVIVGLSLFGVLGCVDSKKKQGSSFSGQYQGQYPIRATVTVGMVADLVREIGGERLEVTQLLGSGVDPHLYKPTRDDVTLLTKADIVFFNGLYLEGKMAETLQRLSEKKRSVAVAERLNAEGLNAEHTGDEHPDPHVWMDVSLWSEVAQVIGDELSQYDPPHKEDYQKRTQELRAKLDALHQYGLTQIASIPKDQRVLVTSHDAFRYFGRAYGIEVEAIQGISTESEAGLQRMNELVDMLVSRKVQAVFVESSVPKESIESLLLGAQNRGHKVTIAAELYSDAMGDAGTYEGTYIGMMDHNLSSIARALGSTTVPEKGFGKP